MMAALDGAGGARRRFALLLLVMVVVSAGVEMRPRTAQPDAPPALDRFLGAVAAAVPPHAGILVAGNPPALLYFRATALLYPRRVYNSVPTDYPHAFVAPRWSWAALVRLAQRDEARYVLLWDLPREGLAPGTVAVRSDAGLLLTVPS